MQLQKLDMWILIMLGDIRQCFLMDIHSYLHLRSVKLENEVLIYLDADSLLSICHLYDFQESLDGLNQLLKEPLPINRFRPKYLFFHVFWSTPAII